MKEYHPTLERQIKKIFGGRVNFDKDISALLDLVDQAYRHADEGRKLIERSLEISSEELNEKNKHLQEEIKRTERKKKQLEKLNKIMVKRELKMIELKEQLEQQK